MRHEPVRSGFVLAAGLVLLAAWGGSDPTATPTSAPAVATPTPAATPTSAATPTLAPTLA